ncbi:phospholipase A and acyltransferase 3-like [Solea solea]|uniref:phospholipase A and acyltransferase 3-like n=1 Tax=Solea solea TaxID=90069 RepID=UPI00272B91B5|nr:phospholipase A and acyltransferase 3-like [Solea solea]
MGASQSVSVTEPKPGDLIAVDRGNYTHWAVYIGEDEVVHFARINDSGPDKTSLNAEVKCQMLSDMLNGNSYRVNNLLDDKYKPRDLEVIVKEARSRIGQKLTYDVVNYNSEHFVTEMRYGKPESRQSNMNPGDLIEVDRGNSKHWAVYVGENDVVHVTTNDRTPLKAEVMREKLHVMLNGNSYRVNNLLDNKYKPLNPDVIVKEACSRVGQQLLYDATMRNSEHFVTELRYGKRKSRQVKEAVIGVITGPVGLLAAPLLKLTSSLSSSEEPTEAESLTE